MSLKAEWRLRELLGIDDGNPFDTVILSKGLRVDLAGSEEEIFRGLKRTLELESRLFNKGVTCELKDGGQDCLACSMYAGDRPEEEREPLCRLGRDQRVIEQHLQVFRDDRKASLMELADVADDFTEMGYLEPEYGELLCAVGL